MFKKRKKIDEEELETEVEEETEYEKQAHYDRAIRRMNRKYRFKKVILLLCVVIGFVGSLRSCALKPTNTSSKEIEAQTFVKTYAKNYFSYPCDNKYLNKFTLNDEWIISYDEGIELASISDVDIYKVTMDESKTKYFCYGNLQSKFKDKDATQKEIYFAITVVKKSSRYLVVEPVANVSTDIASINDEDTIKEYTFEPDSTTQILDDDQKAQLENTITLFIKTYNDDVTQARLLCTSKGVLDKLDPSITLTVKNIGTATQDDKNTYVIVDMEESNQAVFKATRKYYFEVTKEKNKIQKMEVY